MAFVEWMEPDIFAADGLFLFLYDFETREHTVVWDPTTRGAVYLIGPHEPVFSDDGRWVLMSTYAQGGWPGYSAGILLLDVTSFL